VAGLPIWRFLNQKAPVDDNDSGSPEQSQTNGQNIGQSLIDFWNRAQQDAPNTSGSPSATDPMSVQPKQNQTNGQRIGQSLSDFWNGVQSYLPTAPTVDAGVCYPPPGGGNLPLLPPLFEIPSDPAKSADEGRKPIPGNFAGTFHDDVVNQQIDALSAMNCKVAPKVSFYGLADPGLPGPPKRRTYPDALFECPWIPLHALEAKTWDDPPFTDHQMEVFPQMMVGNSASDDPRITSIFNRTMNARLQPIPVTVVRARRPGGPLEYIDLQPDFARQ
jgi:hypothetical protein